MTSYHSTWGNTSPDFLGFDFGGSLQQHAHSQRQQRQHATKSDPHSFVMNGHLFNDISSKLAVTDEADHDSYINFDAASLDGRFEYETSGESMSSTSPRSSNATSPPTFPSEPTFQNPEQQSITMLYHPPPPQHHLPQFVGHQFPYGPTSRFNPYGYPHLQTAPYPPISEGKYIISPHPRRGLLHSASPTPSTRSSSSASSSVAPDSLLCPHEGCGKHLGTRSALKAHMRVHDDPPSQRSHKCGECDASFRRTHDLRRHCRSIHELIKPFSCVVCGNTFARRVSKFAHCLFFEDSADSFVAS